MTTQKLKRLPFYLYQHHFVRYLFVGGSTFVIDFGILYALHGKLHINLVAATTISYWVSIIYNFIFNRYWTFDAHEKESLSRHIAAYTLLLAVNYVFVLLFVSVVSQHIYYIYAKAIAVILQMIWTYPVYKKLIFVSNQAPSENS